MSQGRLIVACDFGTTMFRAIVTEVDEEGSFKVIGHAEEPAQGFHDGGSCRQRVSAEAHDIDQGAVSQGGEGRRAG